MKLAAIILTAALGAAPAQPEEEPSGMVIQKGQVMRCLADDGCYVLNGAGVDEIARQGFVAGRAACRSEL